MKVAFIPEGRIYVQGWTLEGRDGEGVYCVREESEEPPDICTILKLSKKKIKMKKNKIQYIYLKKK